MSRRTEARCPHAEMTPRGPWLCPAYLQAGTFDTRTGLVGGVAAHLATVHGHPAADALAISSDYINALEAQ